MDFCASDSNAKDSRETIHLLEKLWKQMAPGQPFQYSFLDEDFGKMYTSEQRLSQIFFVFAGLAIVIACLGLFALTSFTAEQRAKEIGIRKVLGATVSEITLMLNEEFLILISVAILIAFPASWYFVSNWLNSFAYRVDITIWVYVVSGLVAVSIGLITISFKTVATALVNPVNSLRSE
jgi:putative ABC transport system permease protein